MSSGEIVSEGRASRTFVGLSLALGILISGLPGAASAAGPVTSAPNAVSAAAKRGVRATTDRGRTYIVTLRVSHAGEAIPASRSGRQRIHARAAQTRAETDRLLRDYEVQPRHRYTAAIAGFSAQMSAEQAAALAGDPAVADIHVARRVYLASEPQVVQRALRRVNGAPDDLGGSGPVDVDIAIMDTGIGPAPDELDVQGGVNCAGDGRATDWWYDSGWFQHGTHVAGLAAAKDNDIGIVGAAPGARLWSIRVFDDTGYGTEDAILCGLDWATRTVTEPYHGTTQPVEVLNMSLEARRGPGAEACTDGDTDLIHRAVCQAAAAGITIVVAAGNVGGARNDRDASKVIPAGYDQVITVGAINDYDGKGGGLAATDCIPSRGPDDEYASYSNVGPDVDIVAPGTCSRSTQPGADSDVPPDGIPDGPSDTQLMSGTSQATPLVTGVVARYLADHPGTSSAQIRRLLRAAGRLDWDSASDPYWSGVNDTDAPHRVLDAASLLGADDLRVWLSSSTFRVSGTSTTRKVRVDVQRGGGFAGSVDLDVAGLSASVGSAAFDRPGSTLARLDGADYWAALGARLTLTLPLDGDEGQRTVTVRGQGGGLAAERDIDLLVDRSGPQVSGLSARIRGGGASLGKGSAAPLVISWTASDTYSSVKRTTLQRRMGSAAWRTVGTADGSMRVSLVPDRTDRFRIKASDSLDNASTSRALPVRLTVRDSAAASWAQPAGGWRTTKASAALRGSLLQTSTADSPLTTSFSGVAVALVAPIGPQRGTLRVRIDGGDWQDVSLHSSTGHQQRVVYARTVADGSHQLEVQAASGQVAVDGILVLD